MSERDNPQAAQMAHESMVRTLSAQAQAIWPQESALLARHALPPEARVLDAGCGTGEWAARAAELWPDASFVGVDVQPGSLSHARGRCAQFGERVRFEERSVYALGLEPASFDLVACRHVLQSIPDAPRVLAELVRVTRPGGLLHLIAEDYAMIQFERGQQLHDVFWASAPATYGESTGTDMRVGRNAYGVLTRLGLEVLSIDYVVVDPVRVSRELMFRIFEAWRDGYVDVLAEATGRSAADIKSHFDDMLETLRKPDGYAVWHVPVIAARVPV